MNSRSFLVLIFIWAAAGLFASPAAAQPADGRGLPTLAPLVNEVTPAVVNISVVTRSPKIIPSAAHLSNVEQTQVFNEAMLAFLTGSRANA